MRQLGIATTFPSLSNQAECAKSTIHWCSGVSVEELSADTCPAEI